MDVNVTMMMNALYKNAQSLLTVSTHLVPTHAAAVRDSETQTNLNVKVNFDILLTSSYLILFMFVL